MNKIFFHLIGTVLQLVVFCLFSFFSPHFISENMIFCNDETRLLMLILIAVRWNLWKKIAFQTSWNEKINEINLSSYTNK